MAVYDGALAKPLTAPISQRFGGHAKAEPEGWVANAADGRPLKAFATHFPGSTHFDDLHKGLDAYAPKGTPIYARQNGVVTSLDRTIGFLRIRIQGQASSYYCEGHCDTILVKVGQVVTKGQKIATVGMRGNADGPHDHIAFEFIEKHSDGVTRRMNYDPARFYPARTWRYGAVYRDAAIKAGWCDKDGYLFGGDLVGDDRIYPIHDVTIAGPGVNVRKSPDLKAPVVFKTTGPTKASQLNVVKGGTWTVGSVTGNTWAKLRLADKSIAYVATALIVPA